ncbi:MAG: hypothetical protein JNK48_19410 [Bryobacterales bacterium]|nr:hypothetical protein [Bryobacterales bacterium]
MAEWRLAKTPLRSNLRGVSAVSRQVAWASGTNGLIVRSTDGGANFFPRTVPGGETLDYRDIEAFGAEVAYVMSAGPGSASRVFKTEDGGQVWKLLLENPDSQGFFDAIAFWDERRGLVMGDPVNGRFTIRVTMDGGVSWKAAAADAMPPARLGEAAFAASGTCLVVGPGGRAWFVTGGAGGGRVFASLDWGRTWSVSETGMAYSTASSGLFAIAAHGAGWVAVGGDYRAEDRGTGNIAVRGAEVRKAPGVFLSGVVLLEGLAMAVGPRGTFLSRDGGKSWETGSEVGFHTVSLAKDGTVYGAGALGRIGRWVD